VKTHLKGKKLDLAQLGKAIVDSVTEQQPNRPKHPAAVELGRLGGLKGGRARAEKLTAKRRKQIAQKAAVARWNKKVNKVDFRG
jgi:hypothetical protein